MDDDVVREIDLALERCAALPEDKRVAIYNSVSSALGRLVADFAPDPACAPQLVPASAIAANDYNPNKVASPELDLLEVSMRADGITMPVVLMPINEGAWVIIDGFHRRVVGTDRLGRRWLVASILSRERGDRMASTIRHNRARGKHQVELMGTIVRALVEEGWDDERIANHLGMSAEELLRLKQVVGAARMLAPKEYEQAWETADGDDDPARRSNHIDQSGAAHQRRE
jgi:ParB-like chromosome segregation protein Spo0J